MKFTRRETLQLACNTLIPMRLTEDAWAAVPWPSKPVRLVVPFPAGGAVDQVARALANAWGQTLGQQFIVDNRAGATGAIGAAEVSRAIPDGHTLLFALDSHAINHLINKSQQFDTFTSFDYLSLLVTLPQVIVVPAVSPMQSLTDLLNRARTESLSYGTTGPASTAHQNVARLLQSQKLKATHVPYKGSAPMMTDVVGGHIHFASGGLSVMLPQINAGNLRALAVSTIKRNAILPNVPAISEVVPGHDVPSWIGLVGPAKMATELKERIISVTHSTLQTPNVRQALEAQSFSIIASGSEEFSKRVRTDATVMQELLNSKAIVLE